MCIRDRGLGEVMNTLLTNFVANPVSALLNGNYIGILFWACLFLSLIHISVCMIRRASAGLNTLSSASTGTSAWRVTYCKIGRAHV